MMKKTFLIFALIGLFNLAHAQEVDVNKLYQSAVEAYNNNDFKKSADNFSQVIELENGIANLQDIILLQAACIFASNRNVEKALDILDFLANERLYSDIDKLNNQNDFDTLHTSIKWKKIIAKVSENKKTLPYRTRINVKKKLLEAKEILTKDNGQLWGYKIWNDSIIVIDNDNTIYSLSKLDDSKTDDDTLYYKTIEPNTLSFVNTTQKYNGGQYATIIYSYLNDSSSTIIHELFHLLQFKHKHFNGNPINYLEESDARILLRLEYQALRNALNAINHNKSIDEVKMYLNDAVVFRKKRQNKYANYLSSEIEIETLEGMANYTGFVLSTVENKHEKAIEEIIKREQAKTYTRTFPYATGPAYGLIFDFLKIDWRNGLEHIYNFANIYESKVLKSEMGVNEKVTKQAEHRNNYPLIYKQEKEREENQEELIAYYTELLIVNPTLKVTLNDVNYERSFDMNGTLSLKDTGIIYSWIKGIDRSGGKNFGNFTSKGQLGQAGILSYEKDSMGYFAFPLPLKTEGSKIIGEFYEIELNPGWKVIKQNDGNMEIVKEK